MLQVRGNGVGRKKGVEDGGEEKKKREKRKDTQPTGLPLINFL